MCCWKKKGLTTAMLDRLLLNPDRIASIADGLRAIAEQNDPVGSECLRSSTVIHECLVTGCTAAGLPEDSIQLVPTTDRAAVGRDCDREIARARPG